MSDRILGSWKAAVTAGIAFAAVAITGKVVVWMYRGRRVLKPVVGFPVVQRDIARVSLEWKVIFGGVLWLCSKCTIVCSILRKLGGLLA